MEKAIEIKRRAQRCIQNGDLDGALNEYEKLVGIEDSDPYNFVLLADLLFKKGEQAEASERYLAAVHSYEKAALYKNAIAVCKKMTRLSLSPAKVLQSLAQLHALDGLAGEAALYYVQYAEHMVRSSAPAEAAHALRKAFDVCQDNIKILEQLSEAWLLAGDPTQASQALLEAATQYRQRGQEDDARRCEQRGNQFEATVAAMHAALPGSPPAAAAHAPAPPVAPAAPVARVAPDAEAPEPPRPPAEPEPAAPARVEEATDFIVGSSLVPKVVQAESGIIRERERLDVKVSRMETTDFTSTLRARQQEGGPGEPQAAGFDGFEHGRARMPAPVAPEAAPDAPAEFVSPFPQMTNGMPDDGGAATAEPPVESDEPEVQAIDEAGEEPIYEIGEEDLLEEPLPADDQDPSGEIYEITEDDLESAPDAGVEPEAEPEPEPEPLEQELHAQAAAPAEPEVGEPAAASQPSLAFTPEAETGSALPEPSAEELGLARVESLLGRAQEQFRAGQRDDASRTLIEAAQAYEYLGRLESAATIYRSLGRGAQAARQTLELWLANCERRRDAREAAQVACELGDRAINEGDPGTARSWFERALEFDPQNDTAQRRIVRLDTSGATGAGMPRETTGSAPAPALEEAGRVEVAVGRGEAVSFDLQGLLTEFQRGVEAQLAGDAQSHYDLGMTYREMGLLEQAVQSFRVASGDPQLMARSLEMIGRCHVEQRRFAEAVGEFRRALAAPLEAGASNAELRFHLGHALVELGEQAAALGEYERVAAEQPDFEDVGSRILALRRVLGKG